MELKLGKMTQKELAEWFGITYNGFKTNAKSKAKKMEILKNYADYHYEGRTVYIDKIHIPVYNRAYNKVEELFKPTWNPNGLDTCSHVGEKIYNDSIEVRSQIKLITTQSYVGRIKRQHYGRNHIDEEGDWGRSSYAWAKKDSKGEYIPLSSEEAKLMKECSYEVYGKTYGEKMALLHTAYLEGEIDKKEFEESMSFISQDTYFDFQEIVYKKLGFLPDRVSFVQNKEDYKEEEKGAF